MMERVGGAAGCIVIGIMIVVFVMWLRAVVSFDPHDPDAGCKPGPDCETCPFPPCDRMKKQKGE